MPQFRNISQTPINQDSCHAANLGGGTHQAALTRDIEPVFYNYDTDVTGLGTVDHRY